ncbi:MAG: DUF4012 domain-containing protein [Microbacterium sp.]
MPESPSNDVLVDAPPARRRRRIWPWVLGIFLLLVTALVAGGFLAVKFFDEAMDVRADLEAAKSRLSNVTELVRSGDQAQFDAVATEVLGYTTSADETVQGPLWEYASWVPFVGQNVAAVRATTEATHILVRDALPASFTILGAMQRENIRFEGGGFNLEPFRQAIGSLPVVDTAFAQAQEKVAAIDRDDLLPIVDDAVGQVLEVIAEAAPIAHTATAVLPTVLTMMGDQGPRTYLVLFQNNAEIRATGGAAAAAVYLRAEAGRLELVGQTGSTTFESGPLVEVQTLELPADTMALYDPEFAISSQNFTRTPNFPTAARLFQSKVSAQEGFAVDGVVSLDPVVLADILSVAGGVNVDGIDITAENAVKLLLSDTYFRFPADQAPADAFFAATSATVFQKLVSGDWDLMQMLDVFAAAGEQQRLYGWFAREEEEQVARELGIDGAMKTDNVGTTEVGIFLNDAAVSKLEYYLSTSVSIACDPAARTVTTSISMTNSVDRDDLTYHIRALRSPRYGGSHTTMLMDVLYFAPPGATITGVDPGAGDAEGLDRLSTEEGRQAQSIAVMVDRGQTRTVSYTSKLAEGELGPISVRYSPTVTDTPVTIAPSCAELTGP